MQRLTVKGWWKCYLVYGWSPPGARRAQKECSIAALLNLCREPFPIFPLFPYSRERLCCRFALTVIFSAERPISRLLGPSIARRAVYLEPSSWTSPIMGKWARRSGDRAASTSRKGRETGATSREEPLLVAIRSSRINRDYCGSSRR